MMSGTDGRRRRGGCGSAGTGTPTSSLDPTSIDYGLAMQGDGDDDDRAQLFGSAADHFRAFRAVLGCRAVGPSCHTSQHGTQNYFTCRAMGRAQSPWAALAQPVVLPRVVPFRAVPFWARVGRPECPGLVMDQEARQHFRSEAEAADNGLRKNWKNSQH